MTPLRVVAAVVLAALVVGFAVTRQHPTVATEGTVVRVVDGDTIVVAGPGTVRILLIDAPETHDNSHAPKGCYGETAKSFLADLLPVGQPVTLVLDREHRDKYGRLLAYVEVGNSDIGLQLVAAGLADVVYYRPNGDRLDNYRRVKASAQAQSLGIWSNRCAP